jgi:DNA adenine methylase
MQPSLFGESEFRYVTPFKLQLLKWIGNKQRFAHEIVSYFPENIGTLCPKRAVGSDVFAPLMQIWQTLHDDPQTLKRWYAERWHRMTSGDKAEEYERIKASYNASPNGADLLFLCRSCYGGVVRFRQADGYMSTPCGVHTPISPEAFARRVNEWRKRTLRTTFLVLDYEQAMAKAERGDIVYCDPPYAHSQSILYGSQTFALKHLFEVIARCKSRGVYVALSIDGTKKSGNHVCEIPIPDGLFEREALVNCGRSMLKRFQMGGRTLEEEVVADRLLLTY